MAILGRKGDTGADRELVEAHKLITTTEVEQIRQSLIEEHADLVVRGMLDSDVRTKLEKIVMKDYRMVTKGNPDVVRYIVRETIGTGVIEEILQDESITDIGYNGNELIIETNDQKRIFDTDVEVTDTYIIRLVNKFANANDRDFTSKNPIFDGRFENIRINAVHTQNTAPESGTTMALRVVRPRLALTEDNFGAFAPPFMKDFFRFAALSKANMVISGTTGTGKTELHKFISSYIPFDHRIILIEDTPETFMKTMFPDKDIFSWVTNDDVSVTELIKAGLRSHPVWMMVTETRGQEAYEMIQTVLSGHSIITSLHATDARAIPARFVNMAKMGYQVDEDSLTRDIRTYFDLGIHIKKVVYHGRVIRYLSEIIGFHPEGDLTIFKQRFVDGHFEYETFDLPESYLTRLEDEMLDVREMNFPTNIKEERPLPEAEVTSYQTVIPLVKKDSGSGVMNKINDLKSSVFNKSEPEDDDLEEPDVNVTFQEEPEDAQEEVSAEDVEQEGEPKNVGLKSKLFGKHKASEEEPDDAQEETSTRDTEQEDKPKKSGLKAKLFGKRKAVEEEPPTQDDTDGSDTMARNISSNVVDMIKAKQNKG